MREPLWQWDELVKATAGEADGAPQAAIAGFSIDTRTLQPGDVFVALKDKRDAREFVPAAFKAGAAAAIVAASHVRAPGDGALLRTREPLSALEDVGRAARARSSARIAAVTGSVGKTGTKEALRLCLSRIGAMHASEKSYNNQWGVPLTLARMPKSARFGVFEIGMNHPGEITPLTRMTRPHVAVITTVEPVHLGYFLSVENIAEAKAEILVGLEPGGIAALPRDNAHFALLEARAREAGARVVTFGLHEAADVRLLRMDVKPDGSSVVASLGGRQLSYRVGAPGEHYVRNSLAVLATIDALGADVDQCLPVLAELRAPQGRGQRTVLDVPGGKILLIDEAYNGQPPSMRAALAAMATTPREAFPRRIAVLGDMLELGQAAPDLHRGLKEAVDRAGVDLVLACGPMMRLLFEDLAPSQRVAWAGTSGGLKSALLETVRPGDVVMIKGSLGMAMAPLVEALLAQFAAAPGGRPGGKDAL